MTLPLKLRVRKGTGDAEAPEPLLAAASPSQGFYLPHSSVCFSLFIFHVLSWHERDLFPSRWKGRFRLALRSHGAQQDEAGVEGRGQLFWIQSIKTARTNRESISPENVLLSPV